MNQNQLEKIISYHQEKYYNQEPEISDKEFDLLWDELERTFPDSTLLSVVGDTSWDGFQKARHIMPMFSQQKAGTIIEFEKWASKYTVSTNIAELKCDGLSLSIQYENGIFIKAVTRGNGEVGDDISQNVIKMQGFIKDLGNDFTGALRCEIIMMHEIFNTKYKSNNKNPRNTASGFSRRKSGKNCRDLSLIYYDAQYSDGRNFNDELTKLETMHSWGLNVIKYWECSTADEVVALRNKLMNSREEYPYDFDGIVVKGNDIDIEDMKRSRPKKQIAFKFEIEKAETKLLDIEWSLSGSFIVPVAILEPVELCGTTVKRASLANPGLIEKLGIRIGDIVAVSKRGEIIPKIEYVVESKNGIEIKVPKMCSCCDTELIKKSNSLYCPNSSCDMKKIHKLKKWIKRIDAKSIGDAMIETLFETGLIKDISDFYTRDLSEIIAVMEKIDGYSSNNISKAFNNIYAVNELSLPNFIAGYDLEGIGRRIIKTTQSKFDSLDKIHNASVSELADIDGIGEITAQQIIEGVNENIDDMNKTLNTGMLKIIRKKEGTKLNGKSFCITGKLENGKRNDYIKTIEENGGDYKKVVVKGLSFLVNNDINSSSSKNKKAKELGIPIISEKEFLENNFKFLGNFEH